MTDIPPALVPIFWAALAVSGVAALTLMGSMTMLLGSQRPFVLRVVWISASVLVSSAVTWILILSNSKF